jgi:hypothetical protein
MTTDPAEIREISDPVERAKKAISLYMRLDGMSKETSRIRREAIEQLLHSGRSKTQIAQDLGVSRSRVQQLVTAGPPAGRLLFGDDRLTVAIGGKYEADKEKPGEVLAREDFVTFNSLRDFLKTLQLDAEAELIPPPGIIRLNRSNLVVICGPRLSPILGQILESDEHLGFNKDIDGWYLQDKSTGKDYRSPDSQGNGGDVAYFGQLPRPDGKGYFLYMAGIHASGPAGVIHYLQGHLAEIYEQSKRGRFSMLISCKFEPETGLVASSKLETSIYIR